MHLCFKLGVWGYLGCKLGGSWSQFGFQIGGYLAHFASKLGALGVILAPVGGSGESCWAILAPSWGSWVHLGCLGPILALMLGGLGLILVPSWGILAPS